LSEAVDSVERSIHVYKLDSTLGFDEIEKVVNYIETVRNSTPSDVLLDVGEKTRFLFLSASGPGTLSGTKFVWLKFGWARRSGLPEAIDARTGRVEVLRLGSDVYLFEPSHFLLFRHGKDILMLYEYNAFAPRPLRLCQYIEEFYRRMKGDPNVKVRVSARRLLARNVEEVLKQFNVVRSLRIELEADAYKNLAEALHKSEEVFRLVFETFSPKYVAITWRSPPRGRLEVSPSDVIEMFRRLEPGLRSIVVTVKKGVRGRSVKIDLKKCFLIFKKHVKLARDSEGNVLRTTDTQDAVDVLKSLVGEVVASLGGS